MKQTKKNIYVRYLDVRNFLICGVISIISFFIFKYLYKLVNKFTVIQYGIIVEMDVIIGRIVLLLLLLLFVGISVISGAFAFFHLTDPSVYNKK